MGTAKNEPIRFCVSCGERLSNTSAKCLQCDIRAETEAIWPPPPTESDLVARATKTRPYLTYHGWLDTIVGIVLGITFWWFFSYGLMRYVMYYTMPHKLVLFHRADFFWNVMVSSIITLLVSAIIWSRLRLFYQRLANTIICASIVEGAALMYFFY